MWPITRVHLVAPSFDKKFWSMFQFGWKLMLSSFLDQLYAQIQVLVVGKKYDSATLGAYNQGSLYPNLVSQNINTSVQTVILPEFSKKKDNYADLKDLMKKTLIFSSYIISPLLVGLFVIADNFVEFVLTSKWENSIPYIRLFCISYLLSPLSITNLQGYSAIGRSDIYLKNEVLKKVFGVVFLCIAILFFHSPISIACSIVVSNCLNSYIDVHYAHRMLSYTYKEQSVDIFVNIGAAVVMGIAVEFLNLLNFDLLTTLILQVFIGGIIYLLISFVINIPGYRVLKEYMNRYRYDFSNDREDE